MKTLALLLLLSPGAVDLEPPELSAAGRFEAETGRQPAAGAGAVWFGPGGEPLPFRDDAEVLDFLRTADIVSDEPISKGVNRSLKVLLEKDGVQAHAVFRRVNARKHGDRRPGSKQIAGFRDSCFFEPAAYELGRLLGVRRIPPVVTRSYLGREGTLQIWVENAFDEQTRLTRNLRSPDPMGWERQKQVRRIFDALIHNIDRNQGNLLIDPRWNVWLIDHTRAFLPESNLPGRRWLRRCDRDLWQRLSTVDRAAVAQALDPYLSKRELRLLFIRWEKLVEHVQGLIDAQGEASVLF